MLAISKKNRYLFILFLIFILISSFAISHFVFAGIWDHRSRYVGYFYNRRDPTGAYEDDNCGGLSGYVLKPKYNCEAFKTAESYGNERVDTVNKFYQFLRESNSSGDSRQKSGSAFIVHTMLGRDGDEAWAKGNLNISERDWADLLVRLNGVDINWNLANYHASVNSYMKPGGPLNGPDVAFDDGGQTDAAIVFYRKGTNIPVYAIFRKCANPDGSLPGLPRERTVVVDPGPPLDTDNRDCRPRHFTLKLSNSFDSNGNYGSVGVKVTMIVDGVRTAIGSYSNSGTYNLSPIYSTDANMSIEYRELRNSYQKKTTTVEDADGNEISQSVSYVLSRTASTRTVSLNKCYNYQLESKVSDTQMNSLEAEAAIFVLPVVENTKAVNGYPNTRSTSTNWQLTQLVYSPGTNINSIKSLANHESTNNPCDYFRNKIAGTTYISCSVPTDDVSQGSRIYNTGTNNLPSVKVKAGDYEAGTKICFSYSVWTDSSEVANFYYNSNAICHTIVKKPKTQVLGSDLIVGRNFDTGSTISNVVSSTSVKASRAYGSWVEYGILPTGSITGTGSASAFSSNYNLTSVSNQCSYSKLSFNNAIGYNSSCSSAIGKYNTNRSIPDITSSFPTNNTLPNRDNFSLDGLASGSSYGTALGHMNFTINSGSEIPSKKWIIINAPSSTVNISANIKYSDGPYTKTNDIPQVVIIAKNINIAEGVTNIDAWLVAKDTINTCSGVGANLSSTVCNQKLTVNGPLMAGKLLLRRTAGAGVGDTTGYPAEVFNLRADTYIWASTHAKTNGVIKSVYTTELPPRY